MLNVNEKALALEVPFTLYYSDSLLTPPPIFAANRKFCLKHLCFSTVYSMHHPSATSIPWQISGGRGRGNEDEEEGEENKTDGEMSDWGHSVVDGQRLSDLGRTEKGGQAEEEGSDWGHSLVA
jgi:hypothetical protein